MKYQLLLVDADHTLFDFDKTEEVSLKNTFEKYGIEYEAKSIDLYQTINRELWDEYEKGKISQKNIQETRFEKWYLVLKGEEGRGIEIETYYEEQLAKGYYLLPGATDFVKNISNYMPVEIVTNGITFVQKSRLALSEIRNFINDIWISEEIGKAKPDPKMINKAIDKHQIDKGKVVFLGDSLKADIGAANRAGIDSIWLTLENQRNKKATYQVMFLEEAQKIIVES